MRNGRVHVDTDLHSDRISDQSFGMQVKIGKTEVYISRSTLRRRKVLLETQTLMLALAANVKNIPGFTTCFTF